MNTTDDLLTTAGLSGTGGPTIGIEGSTNVNDYFMEANIPLVQGKTGVEQLSFDTAYRYSDYSSGIETDTYKFGADWAPVEDVRFRASFQRAVRAPNIVELFTAQGFNLFDMDGDPCGAAIGATSGASLEECVASGVPAANYGSTALDSPAGQYNFNQGGNRCPAAGRVGHHVLRHRVHAALRAWPERVGRLLRHRDRRADFDVRL